jgi:hypothetical protein
MHSATTVNQSRDRLAIMMKFTYALEVLLTAIWCAPRALASTIYSYEAGVAGGGTNAQAPGQEVTTPSGGPWDDIVFNFYDGNGNPVALGTVFLLSQSYSGTASALSTSTPGFVADVMGGGLGGVYTFASSVTLQPNATYFFYDSALSSGEWGNNANFSAIGAGYQGYGAANGGSSSSYTARPFAQAFDLTGTQSVPEPSTVVLTSTALLALGFLGRKQNGRWSRPATPIEERAP